MSAAAWVIAGGKLHPSTLDAAVIAPGDIVVGVDKGIGYCLQRDIVPDVLMGDFDSLDPAQLKDPRLDGVEKQSFPARKNSSDLELALQWLRTSEVSHVRLLAISGGRSDHHLFNWLLPLQGNWPFTIELIDASAHAHLVTPRNPLHTTTTLGQVVSLVPMPQASGVSTQGLEYPLHNAEMTAGSTLGLSNVASQLRIRVSISSGQLLVFRILDTFSNMDYP